MDALHWPLTVLSKAVHFKNLTGASAHIGLSQPQISRLITQLERQFEVTLLDRTSKRKSAWTPAAYRLAEIYTQNARKLQSSIQEVIADQMPCHIHIGSLEGLGELAMRVAQALLSAPNIQTVELDIFDQNDIEEKFYNGDLDIIISSREPGKKKFKYRLEVGGQSMDTFDSKSDFFVFSPYEYGLIKKRPNRKTLISNSLSIRKQWLKNYGGHGQIPSEIRRTRTRDQMPVLIIGTDLLNEKVWKRVEEAASL